MSDIYWSGALISFAFTMVATTISIFSIFSIRAKNLAKIGLYYKISTGDFTSEVPVTFWGYIFGVLLQGVFFIFLSWLGVFLYIATYFKYFSQKFSTPEKLKELQFKLAHADLTKEQVKDTLKEIGTILGQDISFSQDGDMNESDEPTIILEASPDGYFSEITLDIANKKYYSYSHTPDYDGVYNSVYEYKLEDNIIYQRLLETKVEHYGEEYYDVRDNVIMESDIWERNKKNVFQSADDIISNLQTGIQWHELSKTRAYQVVYFIMSHHPEIISKNELKKIIRIDVERVKSGFLKLSEILGEYNAEFQLNSEYGSYEIVYLEERSEEKDTELANKIKDFCGSKDGFGPIYEEIVNKDELIKVANEYL